MCVGVDHSRRDCAGGAGPVVVLSVGLLLLGAALYGLNQAVLKPRLGHPLLHGHLNDVLAGVVFIAYTNLLCLAVTRGRRWLRRAGACLVLMLAVGLFWEVVTPLYRADSVADPRDLLAYVAGGMAAWAAVRLGAARAERREARRVREILECGIGGGAIS